MSDLCLRYLLLHSSLSSSDWGYFYIYGTHLSCIFCITSIPICMSSCRIASSYGKVTGSWSGTEYVQNVKYHIISQRWDFIAGPQILWQQTSCFCLILIRRSIADFFLGPFSSLISGLKCILYWSWGRKQSRNFEIFFEWQPCQCIYLV